jgi:hypothetical protein
VNSSNCTAQVNVSPINKPAYPQYGPPGAHDSRTNSTSSGTSSTGTWVPPVGPPPSLPPRPGHPVGEQGGYHAPENHPAPWMPDEKRENAQRLKLSTMSAVQRCESYAVAISKTFSSRVF